MLGNQQIQSNWPSIKVQVLNQWNKLSEAEVEKTHGAPKALGNLVHRKYGKREDFDKTYEKICNLCTHSSRNVNQESTASAPDYSGPTHGDSPERRLNANYAKVDHNPNINREADDELSAYTAASRTSLDDVSVDEHYNELDNDESYDNFSSPDEFYTFQDPSAGLDIPLGRTRSSATRISTAQAASNSSAVSSSDAKKKI